MTEQKIVQQLELIKSRVYQRRLLQPHFSYKVGNQSLLSPNANDSDWPIIAPGTYWGKPRQDFILRTAFVVPDDWQAPVVFFLPIGKGQDFIHPEALAYIDGIAFQGINAFSQEILLRSCWCDGEKHFLALSGWCGVESGPFLMGQPEVVKIHQPTRNFVASVRVALSVLSELDENDTIYICLKNALEKAWQCLDFHEYLDESIYNRIEDAQRVFDESVLEAGSSLPIEIIATGHAHIVRIFDKVHEREVMPHGEIFNQIQAFEDRPRSPDAWDIDIYFDDEMWLAEPAESIQVIETGPLRISLEIKRKILSSEITQRISLVYNQPRINFDTSIKWRERSILLKAAFPVEVHSPRATYEIQWGNIQRPTHRNTSWDQARFEVCAHKWVDLSEGGYGVSLLNDCKYGHDIRDNIIRLSLLRGTTYPDPNCDLGEHRFTYAIFPHSGSWDERTVQEAYAINDPLIIEQVKDIRDHRKNNDQIALASFFIRSEQSNVVIETIKQAEDGLGIIIRLYEFMGKRRAVTLHTGFSLDEVWATNILEENQELLDTLEFSVSIFVKPYQILTLRMIPQKTDEER